MPAMIDHHRADKAWWQPDRRWHMVLNAAAFQLGWLACVVGGTAAAIPATVVIVSWHLAVCHDRSREIRFLLEALALGLVVDLMLVNSGLLMPATVPQLPPVWLVCLWPLFATTIGYPLRIFLHHRRIAALAGFLGAPLSYVGGAQLAGIEIMQPLWQAVLVIGLVWSAIFPLLLTLYRGRQR